jgi:tetratricopeptide (TPR) repeat protein
VTVYAAGNLKNRIATRALALIALLAPLLAHAQCQPVGDLSKSQTPPTQNPLSAQPQFFDEPKFTVAGVTEMTNLGGHGSDTIWRTKEALTKETVSLGKSKESPANPQPAASSSATEKSLREAAQQPTNFDANHLLGKLLLDDGKAREAIPYLEQASRLNPSNYENAYELALAYANAGDYERSRTNALALLARQDNAELHHLLGRVEEQRGNPLEAVHQYQRAAELDPSEPNLFDWGAELLLHNAPEPAIEVFAKGNRLFPRSTRILVGLGVAWYSRGSYDQAAACLCQASDVNPNDPNPYLFLGKIQSAETTPSEETAERMNRFASLQPENALANYYYAVSLWKRRKGPDDTATSAQVESLLDKAVRLDPNLGAAYLQLGILYSERNDFPKAITAYQKAVDADPQLEAAHYRLAQAYRQTGDKSKAQHELQLFEELSKEAEKRAERDRHEIQQFVYTLRGQSAQPQ